MDGWKFWWGIAAFFLGGLATQLNGWLTYRRQRADRAEADAAAVKQRRVDFELEHLMAVNQKLRDYREKLLLFTAAASQVREADLADRESRAGALREMNEVLNAAEVELDSHVGFLLDEEVRTAVRQARNAIDDAAGHALISAVDYAAVNETVSMAFQSLSARVRDLYMEGRPHGS
ncbi:hypothetical protein ACWC3X_07350 [Streptomyces populi]